MSEKIILFLSESRPLSRETLFLCPENTVVPGVLTNDAPVRYLLETHPNVKEILCIMNSAEEKDTLSLIRSEIEKISPGISFLQISYSDRTDFMYRAIPEVLSHLSTGDSIWLDITGAVPETVMFVLLLSRALSYCGIPTEGAVDASPARGRVGTVRDVTHLIRLFDLLGGMQELTGRGNVQALRSFCAHSPAGSAMNDLLAALDDLTEAVTLCHASRIPERMERFSDALEIAGQYEDPLMQKLLKTFRARFQLPHGGESKRLTIPGLIQWYLSNGMVQHALTVYTEQIPAYLLKEIHLITISSDVLREEPLDYEDPLTVQFQQGFLKLSDRRNPVKMFRHYLETNHAEIADVVHRKKPLESLTPPKNLAAGVDNLVRITRLAYPEAGNFEPHWAARLPRRKAFLALLEDRLSRQPPKTADAMLRKAAQFPKQDLWVLMELDASVQTLPTEALTVELLPDLLPGSGYTALCSLDRLACVCRDYLYVKMMRTLSSHSSRSMTIPQQELLLYLSEHNECGYYSPPGEMSTETLIHCLSCCLENIRLAQLSSRNREAHSESEEERVALQEANADWEMSDQPQ